MKNIYNDQYQSLSYIPETFEKMVIALNSIAAPKMYFIHYKTTFFFLGRISKYLLSALLCGWKRKWQPTSVFLPGESHGQRSLSGYSPFDCRVRHN